MPRWSKETSLDRNHKPQCENLPSSTVTKSWATKPQERFVVNADGDQIRELSWEEVSRLQGFPDGWLDVDGITDRNRVGLAGNAVPPPVALAVFRALARVVPGRKLVELFAGAGGLALGAQGAGFAVRALVDHWEPSCRVLRAHFPLEIVHCMSVDDFPFEQLRGRVDVLSGGPPCQPFSSGGKRAGQDDSRDRCTALPLMLQQLQPQAFFFEEARELYNHEGGLYWERLVAAFHKVGYRIGAMLVNAHDYGVPQTRCRAMVVGLRHGDPGAWTRAMIAQAQPGQGGIVADALEGWEPWEYGCRRGAPRRDCTTRIIFCD